MIRFPLTATHGKADDYEARRKAFNRLRQQLGMSAAEIAGLTGLATGTIKNYSAPQQPNQVATWRTIEIMRREAVRRARANVIVVRDKLDEAESVLRELENDKAA